MKKFRKDQQFECVRVTDNNEYNKTLTLIRDCWNTFEFKELKGLFKGYICEDGKMIFTKIGKSNIRYEQK